MRLTMRLHVPGLFCAVALAIAVLRGAGEVWFGEYWEQRFTFPLTVN